MVRLCHGAERGDARKDVPKGGFISVASWTGLCFGEGEVPLWLTAPSTFSSRSHLNRAVLAGDGGHRAASTTELLLEPKAPREPALVAHSHQDRQAACSNISLFTLLQRRRRWEKLSSR